ncbi:MAG: hypothetical protein AAF928_02135 [Myxococcota bacterium]
MAIADAFTNLSLREKRLLSLLGLVAMLLVVVGGPVYLYFEVSEIQTRNDEIRKVMARIDRAQPVLVERRGEREARLLRFNKPAPPLATFIEKQASAYGLEVPQSKDQPEREVDGYTQRTTDVKLKKVGLRPLVQMLEKIERSGHPIAITQLVITKMASVPDQYNVTLGVSAYDKPKPKRGSGATAKSASAPAAAAAGPDEDEEP